MDRILIYLLYTLLLLIMYIDTNKKYIPNFLNILILFLSIYIKGLCNFYEFFIGAGIFVLPSLLMYGYLSDFLKKDVLGFGDIKLIISLGGLAYLGDKSLFLQVYIFYLLSFASASLYILFLFIYKYTWNKKIILRNKQLAFSPFLCISFLVCYNFSELLEKFYEKICF